jgi:hypothetical protein
MKTTGWHRCRTRGNIAFRRGQWGRTKLSEPWGWTLAERHGVKALMQGWKR